jgi:hypothetical protein
MSTSEAADRTAILRAQRLSDQGRFQDSNVILAAVLSAGGPSRRFRAKLLGLMGLNHHWLGEAEAALDCTRAAFRAATDAADRDGVRIYGASLAFLEAAGR